MFNFVFADLRVMINYTRCNKAVLQMAVRGSRHVIYSSWKEFITDLSTWSSLKGRIGSLKSLIRSKVFRNGRDLETKEYDWMDQE